MSGRVVLVGLDSLDFVLARRLVGEGRMPTLGRLWREWWSAPVVTPPALVVAGVWPSINSGTWPTRHGLYCDRQLIPGTYEAGFVGPRDLRVPDLYTRLSAAGRRCVAIDVPLMAPSPVPSGEQLIEWGTHDRFLPAQGAPAAFLDDVVERFGEYPVQPKCDDYVGDLPRLRDDLLRATEAKGAMVRHYLAALEWDYFATAFCEAHCAGHHFWALHDETHPARDPALVRQLGDPLVDVYEAVDRELGALLEQVPSDAEVFVVLSHGAGAHHDGDHLLSALLRELDRSGPRDRMAFARERVRRVAARGRRRRERLLPLDGGRRFFKVPNNELFGAIRLNVVGREPRGRVDPDDVDAVVAELTEALLELENADTGSPIVRQVLRAEDLYDGAGHDFLPDLFVDWNHDEPILAARSPRVGIVERGILTRRTGDHRPHGQLLVRATNAGASGALLQRSIPVVDIAPTIAARLGVALDDVDGTPIPQLTSNP